MLQIKKNMPALETSKFGEIFHKIKEGIQGIGADDTDTLVESFIRRMTLRCLITYGYKMKSGT